MAVEQSGFSDEAMQRNLHELAQNSYPGRGIVLGHTEDGQHAVQAYWVMGRSDNSRNRVLVQDGDTVRTEAFDPAAVEDPSLIIYNAMRRHVRKFVVSNGDQTDTIMERYQAFGGTESFHEHFVDALLTREFEPDRPNFTPRISGYVDLAFRGIQSTYGFSVIKRDELTGLPVHTFGKGNVFVDLPPGAGVCLHTYEGDGDPLPSFSGTPFAVPVGETAEQIASEFWGSINDINRVALVARTINLEDGTSETVIRNQLHPEDGRGLN